MSRVVISEATVAIENSAKYVFKVITSRVMRLTRCFRNES